MARPLPPTSKDLQQQLGAAGNKFQRLQQLSRPQQHQHAQPGESDNDNVDALNKWFAYFGLAKSAAALQEAGLDEYGMINTLDDEDVEDVIKETKLPKLKAKAFRKGIQAVKDGKYRASTAIQRVDPTLVKLRESRKELKGYQYRTSDPMNANDGKQTRTVIFIGQTGAGKTTLINSMTNYLHSVGYAEPFRYKLIMEEKDASIDTKDTTKSQTQNITKYHLRDLHAIGFAMNIIDTPGFGDTEGPEQDKKIRGKFKDFFNEEDRIDAIYFVIKSSDTRLGAIQRYIFGLVLDLFGNDVKENIFILFTFSDGAKPPALSAVKKLKVPFAEHYQINNSGFGFINLDEMQALTHEMFFDLGMKQFEVIFKALAKVRPVSTKLTRETLKERDTITSRLHDIGQKLKTALDEIDGMHQIKKYIEANKDSMDANKDFKFPDTDVNQWNDPLPSGHYTTYCTVCVHTCHENCGIPNNADKSGCDAMRDGYCQRCQLKCKWNLHENKPYIVRRQTVTVWKTKQEMADKYNIAAGNKAKYEDYMRAAIMKIDTLEAEIIDTIKQMKQSVNRLREIALNTEVLTDDQYFDTLMQTEKDERKPNWEHRVMQLENMKRQNKLLRDVTEKDEEAFLQQAEFRNNHHLKTYRQQYHHNDVNLPANQQPRTTTTTVTRNEIKVLGKTIYSNTTTVSGSGD